MPKAPILFKGDQSSKFVGEFFDIMKRHNRTSIAISVTNAFVQAGYTKRAAEYAISELSKTIMHTPGRPPLGIKPSLRIVTGGKK